MKEIEFQSVVGSNFKMFVGKKGRFTLYLGGEGLVYVRGINKEAPELGANNVGKTSIFDALTWCLFGRTVDNLRNPDIKPWSKNAGNPHVAVGLKVGGDEHLIMRSTAPNKLTLNDGETSQDAIDELLGFGYNLFVFTILLGQGQPLFLDLTPEKMMEMFSFVLDLDRWEERSSKASKEVIALERDLAEAEGELMGAEATVKEVDNLLASAKKLAAEWDAERKDGVKKQETELADLRKKLTNAQARKDEADLAYDNAATELKALENTKFGDELVEVSTRLEKIKLQLADVQRRGASLEEALDKLGETDACPTCGQSIDGTELGKHKAEVKKEIAVLAEEGRKLKKRREAALKEHAECARDANNAAQGRLAFKTKAEQAEAQLKLKTETVTTLTTKISGLVTQIKTQKEESNPHREQIQILRKRQQKQDTKLDELDKEIASLKRLIERTKLWVQGFKDIRLYVLEEALQDLELATNALLPDMGLIDWQVKYAIERETAKGTMKRGLSVSVLSPANDWPVKWQVWGGGVSQRLRIASTLALSEVLLERAGAHTNLEILDEPSRGMSIEGVQDLCEFLAARAKQQQKSIFYVDHAAVESSHFTDTVTVVATENGSHLE